MKNIADYARQAREDDYRTGAKSWYLHDRPFYGCRERVASPGASEWMDAQDARLAASLERRDASWDELAERIAINECESKSSDIRDAILPPIAGQTEFLPKLLNGSQAKTAFALRMNAEKMIKEDGLNSTGFLTLTVGNYDRDGKFVQVRDSAEASRRINNLNRRVLPDLFERAIIVTERHKSGAIHFHILGTLAGRPDIRSGLKFEALKMRDYRSAPDALRDLWAFLRDILPKYGFGRAELLPVKKSGEAVASYVSKYIEKNVCNRTADDAHKKLVRYLGWNKKQLKPNEFAWAGKKAVAWRCKARALAKLIHIEEPEQAAIALGPRWAFKLSNLWQATLGDDLQNGFSWNYQEREFMRGQLANQALAWARKKEAETLQFSELMPEIRELIRQKAETQLRQNN